jgi:hypothetical protein
MALELDSPPPGTHASVCKAQAALSVVLNHTISSRLKSTVKELDWYREERQTLEDVVDRTLRSERVLVRTIEKLVEILNAAVPGWQDMMED